MYRYEVIFHGRWGSRGHDSGTVTSILRERGYNPLRLTSPIETVGSKRYIYYPEKEIDGQTLDLLNGLTGVVVRPYYKRLGRFTPFNDPALCAPAS